MTKGYLSSSAKGRGGSRPTSTHQMRAIHALAQCEGMEVVGMAVEVVCQISLHGQSAELRLPYSDTKYACHAVASGAISRLAVDLAHAAALVEDQDRTASLVRAKALLDSGAWDWANVVNGDTQAICGEAADQEL